MNNKEKQNVLEKKGYQIHCTESGNSLKHEKTLQNKKSSTRFSQHCTKHNLISTQYKIEHI